MIYLIIDEKIRINVSNCNNTQLNYIVCELESTHSIYLKRVVL